MVRGTLTRLRENALAMSVSPDGSTVAFTEAWGRELWLMGIHGDAPRKLDGASDHSNYGSVVWSPDSTRLLYIRRDWSGKDLRVWMETRNLTGGPPVPLLTDDRILNAYWLPDGRILFALGEHDLSGDNCNYWGAPMNSKTGQFAAKPAQLTHSTGFCMTSPSATDGRHVAMPGYAQNSNAWMMQNF